MNYLLILLTFCFSAMALATEINIVQVDKVFMRDISDEQVEKVWDDPSIEEKFKIETIEAKVGDVLNFKNRDEARHNVNGKIQSRDVFDVKLQSPGSENDKKVTLDKPGEYTVECIIHPKMKFKVIVK